MNEPRNEVNLLILHANASFVPRIVWRMVPNLLSTVKDVARCLGILSGKKANLPIERLTLGYKKLFFY